MSDRTRLIALYCVEPRHDGHDDLTRFPEPVPCKDCPDCVQEATERILGARALIEVDVSYINNRYILYVRQITRERREHGQSDAHLLFAPCNLKHTLEAQPRFSAKRLATITPAPDVLAEMVHRSRLLKSDEAAARRRDAAPELAKLLQYPGGPA